MNSSSSRRNFLAAAGLAIPAAGLAKPAAEKPAAPKSEVKDGPKFTYRTLGKTGLKPTAVGFGCMITSDQSVIERAADIGITYFDTARGYQGGNNERMVGAALKSKRNSLTLSSKSASPTKEQALADLDKSLQEIGTDHLDIWYLHAKSKPEHLTDGLLEAQNIAKSQADHRVRWAPLARRNTHECPSRTNFLTFLVRDSFPINHGQIGHPGIASASSFLAWMMSLI